MKILFRFANVDRGLQFEGPRAYKFLKDILPKYKYGRLMNIHTSRIVVARHIILESLKNENRLYS